MLYINEFAEVFTLPFGIYINNATWTLLNYTGISLLPFAYCIFNATKDAYNQPIREGNKGQVAIRQCSISLLSMLVVLIVFITPSGTSVSITNANQSSFICAQDSLIDYSAMNSNERASFISNVSGSIPIGVGLIHNYTSIATNAITAVIPCENDLRALALSISSTSFKTIPVDRFSKIFVQQCYSKAIQSAYKAGAILDPEQDSIVTSSVLQARYVNSSMTIPLSLWNDPGFQSYQIGLPAFDLPNAEAEVNCADAYQSLKNAALAEAAVDPNYNLLDSFLDAGSMFFRAPLASMLNIACSPITAQNQYNFCNDSAATTMELKQNLYLTRKITNSQVSPDKTLDLENRFDLGETLQYGITRGIGAVVGIPEYAKSLIFKFIAPIVISCLQMLVLWLFPLIITVTGYSFKSAVLLSWYYITFEFAQTTLAFCGWVENSLSVALQSQQANGADAVADSAITIFSLSLYIVLPLMYFTLMSLVAASISSSLKVAGGVLSSSSNSMTQKGRSLLSRDIGKNKQVRQRVYRSRSKQ